MRISYGEDPNQFGELRIPEGAGPHPVVAFIHGGFWRARFDLTNANAACEALTASGLATWNLEYRRIGQPGGGWPGTCEDVLAGIGHLPRILDPTPVVIVGHSAGGHLALWAAARNALPICGVVALAGVSDLRYALELDLSSGVAGEFMGDGDWSAASPIEMLPIGVPQVLIHGTADSIVPFSMSRRFAEKSGNSRLVPLEGAGHSEVIDPGSAEWQIVQREIVGLIANLHAGC